jgi:nicotinate-nucleotide pyrophosphorylase (carboxylating)
MSSLLFNTPAVQSLINLALEEDLGRGDVTTQAVLPDSIYAKAKLVARSACTLAGIGIANAVFKRINPEMIIEERAKDGDVVLPGTIIATYQGEASAILAAERTALNFVQRLSGIATLVRTYVLAAHGTNLRITDTRKTTPGYRLLEKYAVRMGGASNHRFDLGSGVLIKDNHIAVAGGVGTAIERARGHVPHGMMIEVEVDSIAQFDEALATGVDIILLDNFSLADMELAVSRIRSLPHRPLIEVSGGITLERIPALARTGVDIVSVGALTHSAPSVDLALDIDMNDLSPCPS